MKKGNILGQYIAEVLLIAVFAFAASGITSNMFAATVADTLLQQTVQSNNLQDNAEDDTTMKSIDMGSMLEDEKARCASTCSAPAAGSIAAERNTPYSGNSAPDSTPSSSARRRSGRCSRCAAAR